MKKILVLMLIIIPVIAFAGEWYAGGNLHRKLMRDWVAASYSNRLATSADFVVTATPKPQQVQLFTNNTRPLKVKAFGLETCISETAEEPSTMSMKVAEIAAVCFMLMGY